MGIIVEFPADAALRRAGSGMDAAQRATSAKILILPSVRIERHSDETRGGPEEGTAQGRRRKRRARS